MTKTHLPKVSEIKRQWYEFDAAKYPLGRLATRVATILRGKHKPAYTPFLDAGDFVVVINAKILKLTGRKAEQKKYHSYSGYPGGLKTRSVKTLLEKSPISVIQRAVRGMLPTNRLRKKFLRRLKVMEGDKHTYKIDHKL